MDQRDASISIFLGKDSCVNAPQTLPLPRVQALPMTHQALPIALNHPSIGCEARPGGKMEVRARARIADTQLSLKSFGVPFRFFPGDFR